MEIRNAWNLKHLQSIFGIIIIIFVLHQQAMASTEDKAYEIMRELDVNYVLVIFGGLTGILL